MEAGLLFYIDLKTSEPPGWLQPERQLLSSLPSGSLLSVAGCDITHHLVRVGLLSL